MKPLAVSARAAVDYADTVRDVRKRLGALDQGLAPVAVIPLSRWRFMIKDSRDFIDAELLWLALSLGWSLPQLWGLDRRAPWYRTDHMGLLWFVVGGLVDEITEGAASLSTASGGRFTYRRREFPAREVALPWELGK